MWYALVEQQREWMRVWRETTRHAFDAWPAATLPHAASSCYDDLFEPLLGPPAGPPRFDIAWPAVDERIVARTPFCNLRRFTHADTRRTVLLCAPLAGHAAVMMRETVETLLADGDVCVTDWRNARDVPPESGRFGLDEYVATLDGFVDGLAADDRPLHVVAVCQATVPALGALALRAARGLPPPASITLIGGPLDARLNPSALGTAATTHSLAWCRRHLIDIVPPGFAGHGRHVFPTYLQQGEIALMYPQRFLSLIEAYALAASRFDLAGLAGARRALREYTALLDMPAEYFLDTVDIVFQRMSLANGTWDVGGRRVEPAALRGVTLLTVEGACDAVTGAGQTHAALDMCSGLSAGERYRVDIDDCDHYGLFTGARWHGSVHPALQRVFALAEAAHPPGIGRA
ncbi:esterase [Burkholderia stabilis]|uniref:polyhydroxyalkanoate depolymerase n=1 Tax=Burkholderia stabilis TaxID=95485 RepID=UPI000851B161|nr:polyhydroxyalkanoate depolymerase [Burkholderia stabilis]AOR67081.1 esterase [Burkholderia stabilis]HDR9493384.1 polyhydroxyalkanoate depolymerase [Burkholderia stabilis]HDR9527071.1 polyhydroxyalkanoate depolymerase [Burkholderia stabilis]HDR9534425.1 polyhydroxyalkanoate depolymerase [Burkholderia stabilis]HDR9540703.1 polyhydroxyalkanoate depolymerase [Burkholderia stabilis]